MMIIVEKQGFSAMQIGLWPIIGGRRENGVGKRTHTLLQVSCNSTKHILGSISEMRSQGTTIQCNIYAAGNATKLGRVAALTEVIMQFALAELGIKMCATDKLSYQ